MQVSTDVTINAGKDVVWNTITDIVNSQNVISGINKIEVIDHPEDKLEGLKWKETRMMFGKEATETMWITDSRENEYYCTRAESHGSVYITKLSLSETDKITTLTMAFEGIPQSMGAKLLSFFMSPIIKKSLKKVIVNDLEDIKKHIENGADS